DDAGVFRDPRDYPRRSVATTGTHDTSPIAVWGEHELDDDARRALTRGPASSPLAAAAATAAPAPQAAPLAGLRAPASGRVVRRCPDAYGGGERINVRATVATTSWSYRLPWTVEELHGPASEPLRARLRALAERHGRT